MQLVGSQLGLLGREPRAHRVRALLRPGLCVRHQLSPPRPLAGSRLRPPRTWGPWGGAPRMLSCRGSGGASLLPAPGLASRAGTQGPAAGNRHPATHASGGRSPGIVPRAGPGRDAAASAFRAAAPRACSCGFRPGPGLACGAGSRGPESARTGDPGAGAQVLGEELSGQSRYG